MKKLLGILLLTQMAQTLAHDDLRYNTRIIPIEGRVPTVQCFQGRFYSNVKAYGQKPIIVEVHDTRRFQFYYQIFDRPFINRPDRLLATCDYINLFYQ